MVDSHDDEEPAATPVLPPPATLLAIDQQNTAALRTEARRYRRISFDVAANDPKDARAIHHHLTHASQGDCSPIMFAALVFRIANALKDLAQGDPDALAMLACWRDGVTVGGEVLARTQLTTAAYKATRKRLLTLRDKLPPELRDAAHDLLRSAS